MRYSMHIVDWYTAGRVMLDAIERASSLNSEAINEAMGKDKQDLRSRSGSSTTRTMCSYFGL